MNKKTPIFKAVFGSAWEKLPSVFQKRYINRGFSNDIATVEGVMDIHYSKLMACFVPFFRLFHILVPYQGTNIPVTVDFHSAIDSNDLQLARKFYFPNKSPYEFNSTVQAIRDNDVIERMAYGLGWRMHYFFDGRKVVMQHRGYVLRIFGLNVRIPLEIFIGKSHTEEIVIDENSYKIIMTITHPLFGTLYHYSGNFRFIRLPT